MQLLNSVLYNFTQLCKIGELVFLINIFPAIITVVSGELIIRNRAHYLVFLTGRAGVINYRDYKRNSKNETTDIKRV